MSSDLVEKESAARWISRRPDAVLVDGRADSTAYAALNRILRDPSAEGICVGVAGRVGNGLAAGRVANQGDLACHWR